MSEVIGWLIIAACYVPFFIWAAGQRSENRRIDLMEHDEKLRAEWEKEQRGR